MQKILFLSIALLTVVLWMPCYGDTLGEQTVMELVEKGKDLDGSEVTLTVEAIGDVMKRGEFTWVNGLDSTGAIGLWMPAELASEIKTLGNGKFKGDILQIRGIFNRSCQEHGGDMDIHVTDLEKLNSGYKTDHKISQTKITYTLIATFVAAAIGAVFLRQRRH